MDKLSFARPGGLIGLIRRPGAVPVFVGIGRPASPATMIARPGAVAVFPFDPRLLRRNRSTL
jgi:hypothetical protein